MNGIHFSKQFNWRILLVRIPVNALALLVISILPDIHFVEPTLLRVLFVALILGVLNAFIKPIVQFLTLRFIFITYGFAVVIINAIILLLLNIVVSSMFVVDSLLWALIGGALMGLLTAFLESLFGLQMPLLEEAIDGPTSQLADPSRAFGTMLVSEVVGAGEELAEEVAPANEAHDAAQDDAAQDDAAQDDAAQDDAVQDDAVQDDAAQDVAVQDDAAQDDAAQDDAADDVETPRQGEEQ